MNELVEWMRQRIAELRAEAQARVDDPPYAVMYLLDGSDQEVPQGVEAARAEVSGFDADLKILDKYREALEAGDQTVWNGGEFARIVTLEGVIKLRALAYAHLPGYREEWKP